jgi:hypothetical protein
MMKLLLWEREKEKHQKDGAYKSKNKRRGSEINVYMSC